MSNKIAYAAMAALGFAGFSTALAAYAADKPAPARPACRFTLERAARSNPDEPVENWVMVCHRIAVQQDAPELADTGLPSIVAVRAAVAAASLQ